MDAGNQLRKDHERGDVFALSAVGAIQQARRRRNAGDDGPSPKTAYVVRSLKHPDEVRTLREVYGAAPGDLMTSVSSSTKLWLLAVLAVAALSGGCGNDLDDDVDAKAENLAS